MCPALFVYLRYLPYISCADIVSILRNPTSRPIFHIRPVYGLVFYIFHGCLSLCLNPRMPIIFSLYHVFPTPFSFYIRVQAINLRRLSETGRPSEPSMNPGNDNQPGDWPHNAKRGPDRPDIGFYRD